MSPQDDAVKVKYETLRAMDQSDPLDLEAQLSAERVSQDLSCLKTTRSRGSCSFEMVLRMI